MEKVILPSISGQPINLYPTSDIPNDEGFRLLLVYPNDSIVRAEVRKNADTGTHFLVQQGGENQLHTHNFKGWVNVGWNDAGTRLYPEPPEEPEDRRPISELAAMLLHPEEQAHPVEVPRNAHGEIIAHEYILNLARSFPCLRGKVSHLTPETWSVNEFMDRSGPWSTGEKHAARFIASVWNYAAARDKGWLPDILDFVSMADRGNRDALIAWLKNPVWP